MKAAKAQPRKKPFYPAEQLNELAGKFSYPVPVYWSQAHILRLDDLMRQKMLADFEPLIALMTYLEVTGTKQLNSSLEMLRHCALARHHVLRLGMNGKILVPIHADHWTLLKFAGYPAMMRQIDDVAMTLLNAQSGESLHCIHERMRHLASPANAAGRTYTVRGQIKKLQGDISDAAKLASTASPAGSQPGPEKLVRKHRKKLRDGVPV